MLELESGVHFDFEECFEVEDDALQIDDENFGRLLEEDLFGYLFYFSVAV